MEMAQFSYPRHVGTLYQALSRARQARQRLSSIQTPVRQGKDSASPGNQGIKDLSNVCVGKKEVGAMIMEEEMIT